MPACSRIKKGGYSMSFMAKDNLFGSEITVYQEYRSKRCVTGLRGMIPGDCLDVRFKQVPLIPKETSKFKRSLQALCESYLGQ